jgi:hypothetical protein
MSKPLPQRLDDLARWTGLYRMTMIERGEPRNLRWIPLLIVLAMPVGYVCMTLGFRDIRDKGMLTLVAIGMLLFFGAFTGSILIRFLGPRLVATVDSPLDERERAIRYRALSISSGGLTILAALCCFYMASAKFFGLWAPEESQQWIWLGFMIEGWWFALPVFVASWLEPRSVDADAD